MIAPPGDVTLELRAAMLCLDCDTLFAVGPERCPACAGGQWRPLERFFAERARRPALEEVLHHAGNGLTPARIRAELLARTLAFYVDVGFARNPEFLRLAIRRAHEVLEAIDMTMTRLRALAPPTDEGSRIR